MIHVRLFISLSIHGDSFHGAEEFYGACEAIRSHPRPTENTGLSQGSQRRQPER